MDINLLYIIFSDSYKNDKKYFDWKYWSRIRQKIEINLAIKLS